MLSLVPFPYRILAILALVAAVFGYGWVRGADHIQARWDAQVAKSNALIDKIHIRQVEAAAKVVTQYVDRVQTITKQADTVYREVPVYVHDFAANADCRSTLGSVGVLVNAAESSSAVPPTPGGADAATSTPTEVADWAIATVEACRKNSEQLIGLQSWITNEVSASH